MSEQDRWEPFTKEEWGIIHHALRVLRTHPLSLNAEDDALAKGLADEIWDRHAARVAAAVDRAIGEINPDTIERMFRRDR